LGRQQAGGEGGGEFLFLWNEYSAYFCDLKEIKEGNNEKCNLFI